MINSFSRLDELLQTIIRVHIRDIVFSTQRKGTFPLISSEMHISEFNRWCVLMDGIVGDEIASQSPNNEQLFTRSMKHRTDRYSVKGGFASEEACCVEVN